MSAAGDIRTAVERGGGRHEISVRELRDAFGFPRLTAARRDEIIDALAEQGLEVEPPLVQGRLDDRVEIVEIAVVHLPPPLPPLTVAAREAAATASLDSIPPRPSKKGSRVRWARRRGVLAGAVVGLLVVLTAAVYGAGHHDDAPGEPATAAAAATARATTAAPSGTTTAPAGAPTAAREGVAALLAEAQAAIAARDPATAERVLAGIDAAAIAADPDLVGQVAAARREAGLLGRYLSAKALADAGSYDEARTAMLALAPFRKSEALAENYARLAAR